MNFKKVLEKSTFFSCWWSYIDVRIFVITQKQKFPSKLKTNQINFYIAFARTKGIQDLLGLGNPSVLQR